MGEDLYQDVVRERFTAPPPAPPGDDAATVARRRQVLWEMGQPAHRDAHDEGAAE